MSNKDASLLPCCVLRCPKIPVWTRVLDIFRQGICCFPVIFQENVESSFECFTPIPDVSNMKMQAWKSL